MSRTRIGVPDGARRPISRRAGWIAPVLLLMACGPMGTRMTCVDPTAVPQPDGAIEMRSLAIDGRLATGAGRTFALGTSWASFPRSARRVPWVADLDAGAGIPLPTTSDHIHFPGAVVDSSGALHVLWGETVDDTSSYAPAQIVRYASFVEGEWSGSSLVMDARPDGLQWTVGTHSPPWLEESGELHVLAIRNPPALMHIRSDSTRARWSSSIVPNVWMPVYVSFTTGPGNRIEVAYISADRNSPRFDRNSVFFVSSDDSGETWSTPVLVSRSGEHDALDPRLVRRGGEYDLIWRKSLDEGMTLWFSNSRDGGATWSRPAQIAPVGGISQTVEVAADTAGIQLLYVTGGGGSSNLAYYMHRSGDVWSDPINIELGTYETGRTFMFTIADDEPVFAMLSSPDSARPIQRRLSYWTRGARCLIRGRATR